MAAELEWQQYGGAVGGLDLGLLAHSLGERVLETLRDRVGDVIRQRLGELFQRSASAQGAPGGGGANRNEFEIEQIADSVRYRLADGLRDRVAQAIHEQVGDELRSALWQMGDVGMGIDVDRIADRVRQRMSDNIREQILEDLEAGYCADQQLPLSSCLVKVGEVPLVVIGLGLRDQGGFHNQARSKELALSALVDWMLHGCMQ